jgi:hypothetical protein
MGSTWVAGPTLDQPRTMLVMTPTRRQNRGEPAFGRVNGAPLFDYLGRHPDDAQVLDQAMTSMSETMQLLFLAAYDFGRLPASSMSAADAGHC